MREPDDRATRRFKSLISNIQRESIGSIELAETLTNLLQSGAAPTQRELARQIGKSEQWMSGMLRVLEMPARLQEELRTEEQKLAEAEKALAEQESIRLGDERNYAGNQEQQRIDALNWSVARGDAARYRSLVQDCLDGYDLDGVLSAIASMSWAVWL